MDDDTVGYFKDLASKTAPLRGSGMIDKSTRGQSPIDTSTRKAAAKPETKGVLKYDDDDLKYMSKQAYKIGERLSKSAAKRSPVKQSPKR